MDLHWGGGGGENMTTFGVELDTCEFAESASNDKR